MAAIERDLLDAVKAELSITWTDDSTDNRVWSYIERGKSRLNNIAGCVLDYDEESLPRCLLFDYCRYANSRALEMFEKNFMSELLSLNYDYGR